MSPTNSLQKNLWKTVLFCFFSRAAICTLKANKTEIAGYRDFIQVMTDENWWGPSDCMFTKPCHLNAGGPKGSWVCCGFYATESLIHNSLSQENYILILVTCSKLH